MTSNRFAGFAIAGLLIVIAAAGILAATRPTTSIDPASPVGVVKQYVNAVMDGDHDRAADLFAMNSDCEAEDLDRTYVDPGSRIDLLDSSIDGDRARVRIAIAVPGGGVMGDMWTEERTIRLTKTDGPWKLTGIPWPLYECGVWLK